MRPKEVKKDRSLFLIESAVIGYRLNVYVHFSMSTKRYSKQPVCWDFEQLSTPRSKRLVFKCLKLILSLLVIPSSRNQIFYSNTACCCPPIQNCNFLSLELLNLEMRGYRQFIYQEKISRQTLLPFSSKSPYYTFLNFYTVLALSSGRWKTSLKLVCGRHLRACVKGAWLTPLLQLGYCSNTSSKRTSLTTVTNRASLLTLIDFS